MKRSNNTQRLFATTKVVLASLILSACLGDGIQTPQSNAIKSLPAITPTATLGTPTSLLVRTGSSAVTIAATFTNANGVTLTSASIGTVITGTASCTIGVNSVTDSGATIRLSSCTGTGSIRVNVKAGVLVSSTLTGNAVSGNSSAVYVDNTIPTISTATPTSGTLNAIPSSVVYTFSEAMDPADFIAGNFDVTSSNCGTPPVVGTPVMSSGNTVATVPLTGAVCADGEFVIIVLDRSLVHDTVGNAGSGTTTRTYVFTVGPTVSFGAPSVTLANNADTIDIVATFTNNATSSPTIDTSTIGLTTTSTATCSTISGSSISASGATIQLSGCTGDGTVAAHVNAGVLTSAASIPNLVSGDSTAVTIDNTGPTLSSLTPATSSVATMPTSIVATFSEAMDGATLDDTKFVISGSTCSVTPVIGTVVMSVGDTVATAPITSGTCTDTQAFTVTVTSSASTDAVGNAGTTGATARTYTFDTSGPTVGFGTPSLVLVNSASLASDIVATFTGATNTPTIDGTTAGLTTTGSANCSSVSGTGMSASGGTISISSCTGNGTVALHILANALQDGVGNNNLLSSDSATITVDNLGPTVSSFSPVTGSVGVIPATVDVTFSEAMTTGSVTSADLALAVSNTCASPPAVSGPSFSVGDTVATFTLTGGACGGGEDLAFDVVGSGVTDVIGNAGTGTGSVTYSF